MGLAAASTEQRAFREVWMPALAMVTVCCSITSWMATRSASAILSNSSMHTMPLSASTMAPASSRRSPLSLSWVTAAVSPTPEEPRPVVLMASGATFMTARIIWDLATEGSPTISTLTSPRRCVPLGRFFSCPPSNCSVSAFLIWSWPKMEGASESATTSNRSLRFTSLRMFFMSSWEKEGCATSLASWRTLVATTSVRNVPEVVPLALTGTAL
mmetsp:Transcript_26743/g.50937  ORF Transcript_26743/g.50937 Transcript_26743/m.50937 type:complete len:214 (-) Transcript_26743:816-1457(-)